VDENQTSGNIIFPGTSIGFGTASDTQFTFGASHTYSAPGRYTVTVTATDGAGGKNITTATETIWDSTTVSYLPITSITYGTPLSSTQLDAMISADGWSGTVPGTFAYTVDGNPVTPNQVLPAGPHTLTATFTPTDPEIYHAPSPKSVSLTVNDAPLAITAEDKTVPYGHVPSFTWTSDGWVNGESSSILSTTPNSPPTCGASVNGQPVSATTAPGNYAGAITCAGAVEPNYQISYASGRLIIDPLLSLGEQGLPSAVPHQATLDGKTVTLPVTNMEVPYGSSHSYTFPPTVAGAAGTVYITNDAGRNGAVTTNLSDTAVYRTMSGVIAQALSGGGIDNAGVASSLTRQYAIVQADIAAGHISKALSDLHTFASLVRAQSGKHITTATAQLLLSDAQLVYVSLGGTGSV
jgi:hypothetical protein